MDFQQAINDLALRTWWTYTRDNPSGFDLAYHVFNLAEGAAWVALAALVLERYRQFRRSPIEVGYALAFFTFGLTDFREAYSLQSWLILLKGVNLVAILWLRRIVIRRYYPASKVY